MAFAAVGTTSMRFRIPPVEHSSTRSPIRRGEVRVGHAGPAVPPRHAGLRRFSAGVLAASAGPGPRPRPGALLDERPRGGPLLEDAVAPGTDRLLSPPTRPQRALHPVPGRAGWRPDELLGALPRRS